MFWLRLYLLAGLVLHKAVWEWLKRGRPGPAKKPGSASPVLVTIKAVKIAMLLGFVAQTLLPEMLPITGNASTVRALGVVLYTLGLVVALVGRLQLGSNWSDIEDAQVLRDQAVVSEGLYRFIRHPIYTGDLMLVAGFELALNSWLVLGVLALVPVVFQRAVREERMLAASLLGYGDYCRRTKRFVPFVV